MVFNLDPIKQAIEACFSHKRDKEVYQSDPVKQAIEVCFSHKRDKEVYPSLRIINIAKIFNKLANSQKYLRLV